MSYNPGLLKLDLFCSGIRIDETCRLSDDARPLLRTRGGLGSGLELVLPPELYVNVPVAERFVEETPYVLRKEEGAYYMYRDERRLCRVRLPPKPAFYDAQTSSGKRMSRIGVMQGTYLGIYPTRVCEFWQMNPRMNCKFCSVGLNVGYAEEHTKSVSDVLETVEAAREEEHITFVHFNTGYLFGEELGLLEPYLQAVKEKTGLLVGVQCPPNPERSRYDHLKKLGVDHVSFCLELYDPEKFRQVCPGKHRYLGQQSFFDTMEYCVKVFGRGRVSGEIIAGLEEPRNTVRAIEDFARRGVVSTVCVFRPCLGTELEGQRPPSAGELRPIFRRLYEVCVEHDIPVGIAPNLKVSLVVLPEEGRYFLDKKHRAFIIPELKRGLLRFLYRMYFSIKIQLRRR